MAQPTQDKYGIGRPGGVCAVCGRALVAGEAVFAALRETAEGFERLDVAPEHWAAFDKSDLAATWRTTVPDPTQKKKLFVDDAVLCDLFVRLGGVEEAAKLHFRFVLGLVLMRKRLATLLTTRTDEQGREVWQMKVRGHDEPVDLVDSQPGEAETTEVSAQLSQILDTEA
ncbi:MAG: hypothetical protein ACFCVE_08455 [Phycisphaerae bacterium]